MEGDITVLFKMFNLDWAATGGMIAIIMLLLEAIKADFAVIEGWKAKVVVLIAALGLSLKVYWGINGLDIGAVIASTIAVYLGSRGLYKFVRPKPPTR